MTHLYLITSTAVIPAGCRCRVFGQIHDGRTVLQTSDPLSLDLMDTSIVAWDGMQANGIPIGIDETTPGLWQVWQGEAPQQTIKEQAAAILAQVKPLAYQDPTAVREAIGELFTPDEQRGVIGTVVE